LTEWTTFYILLKRCEVNILKKEYYIITKSIDGVIRYIQETHYGLRCTDNIMDASGFKTKNQAEIALKQWQESWSNHIDLTNASIRKVTITLE
jgi:hypothetical protein